MPDKKLTDSEIVKALECHRHIGKETCDSCPLQGVGMCSFVLINETYNLINRLQAENERLKKGWKADVILTADAKTEAYKEFAERLYEELRMYGIKDKFNKSVFLNVVDKAKKELVGEDNG